MAIKKDELLKLLDEYNGIDNDCIMNIKLIKATANHISESDDLGELESIRNFIANGKAYVTNLNQKRDMAQELHEIFTELTTYVKGANKRQEQRKELIQAKQGLAETDQNIGEATQKTVVQDINRKKRHKGNLIFIALIAVSTIVAVVAGILEMFEIIGTNDIIATACGLLDLCFGVSFFLYELHDDNKAKADIEGTRQSIEKLKVDVHNVDINIKIDENYGDVIGYTEINN
ncbi:MAG: hypothetical protein ACI4QI_06705 [Candidatus Coproplasma sp.]